MITTRDVPIERDDAQPERAEKFAAQLAIAAFTDASMSSALDLLLLSDWLTEEQNGQ